MYNKFCVKTSVVRRRHYQELYKFIKLCVAVCREQKFSDQACRKSVQEGRKRVVNQSMGQF